MFTGLIAELGTFRNLTEDAQACKLTIAAKNVLRDLKIGDSIAVNGACLTVVRLGGGSFTADVMPETLRRTTLHLLAPGARVNLERTLRPSDRLDGHIVTGHVEGVGKIIGVTADKNALVFKIAPPPKLLRYIVEKGSVAIDGISLTVTEVTHEAFGVSLIPHTAAVTTLGFKGVGDFVNLETDILAKYVEKLLQAGNMNPYDAARSEGSSFSPEGMEREKGENNLTLKNLADNGFL